MRVDLFLESKVSSDHSPHKGFTGSHALSTDQTPIPSGVTSVDVVPSFVEELEPTKYWGAWIVALGVWSVQLGIGPEVFQDVAESEFRKNPNDVRSAFESAGFDLRPVTLAEMSQSARDGGFAKIALWVTQDDMQVIPV